MTTPGRNDPCPCRSGKKFKRCCLRARDAALETPGTLAWRRLRRAVDDFAMGKTLLEFVVTTYGPRAADEAWAEFSGLEEPFDPQTPHLALFMSWLFHRWSPDPHDPSSTVSAALHERIPTQLFLEHAGRRLDPVVRRYLEIADDLLHPRVPKLQNTDGEPLEMHRLVFDIDSPEVVLRALADLDFEATAEGLVARAERTSRGEIKRVAWEWKKTGNRMHKSWRNTIQGHLEIKGHKLSAEVNSARRAIELRLLIESRFGDEVRFRADRIQSLEKLIGERAPSGRAADGMDWDAAKLEGPDVTAAVQQLMAEHYESWVSEKIPALDGRTPLEAA